MLPVEILTEAVSFLPLYDLDSVLLASRQLSNIARKCVKGIPVWHFDDVGLFVNESSMLLWALMENSFDVEGRDNTADVLDIALHNACFEYLYLSVSPGGALRLPNKSALEVEELVLCMNGVASVDLLVDVIARFRKVQDIRISGFGNITDFSPVIDLCRQKGIRSVVNQSNGADLMAEKLRCASRFNKAIHTSFL